ncbi:MAG: TIGR01777 family oxidoreductase [Thermoflexales bacterium]|nr:TIGR01777 family oxidoreductase [Thermoflexales bacterium]
MRTIITGGTGLIGRALAASLAADGGEVFVLSRNPEGQALLPSGVKAVRWDGLTPQGWGELAGGADVIVNLAGESIAAGLWTAGQKRRIIDSRLNAGKAIVRAVQASASKPRVLIQASAVGYYGPCGDEELGEDAPAGDDFLARDVAVPWEESTAQLEALGVRRVVIRTGVVLSAEGGALPKMMLPFKLFIGGPLGSGKQWFPWIHLADQVSAIRFLAENQHARGAVNLSSPDPLTNAQFSRVLGQVMRRPAFMPTPAPALRLLLGEMATVLLDGQRAMPRRLLELGYSFKFAQAEAALRDLLRERDLKH